MFEFGFDQAAGLRASVPVLPARVLPVAATAQPAQGYELLCGLASRIASPDQPVVIVDASSRESEGRTGQEARHLGLLQVLRDPAVSGLGRCADPAEWLVLPGALGLRALANTAAAGGPQVALSRLLVPFASGALVLLYGPAPSLAALFGGLDVPVVVPLVAQPQASMDAYASVKRLHMAGLKPVLAAVDDPDASAGLRRLEETVADCARRHLLLDLECWPEATWGHRALESALAAPERFAQARTIDETSDVITRPSRRVHAHFSWS
ncbi:MAG TPA: hypothetical protein PKC60_04565 [Hydrogenophaga sp.]|uniref:hypothetical protein n=1 Tax=Hydrogenophaga sp. TaxID=1904254 RepID=UPI002C01D526|nr:hypothetical protein [Hydrogenophaga sp.]HMN92485.1 hypothetical protein [Hydrogenophaga sp.]HMP10477.1 hypothetical protein [Hydrogenophaga sp.]